MELLKSEIQPIVETALESLGVDSSLVERMLQTAREADQGDLSLPCFRLRRPSAWRLSPLQRTSRTP